MRSLASKTPCYDRDTHGLVACRVVVRPSSTSRWLRCFVLEIRDLQSSDP